MLSVRGLRKVYKLKRRRKLVALDGVSADFGDRGLVFILGKSGSGKSTLLQLIGGLDKATQGAVIIDGRSSVKFRDNDYDDYRNSCVGFVFQEYNLIEDYTVGTNIGLAFELQGKKADRAEIESLLERIGLVDTAGRPLFDKNVGELSGGQRQRVAIARALIKNPQIILADEPTGALDSTTGAQLYDLLKSLSQDKLVLVVSHDSSAAYRYGDRIIELSDGVIVKDSLTSPLPSALSVEYAENRTRFIRSKLPLKRSFLMGASVLKHKKFRLITSVLLALITFLFFGFSMTALTADKYSVELNMLYENGNNYAGITWLSSDSYYLTKIKEYSGDAEAIPLAFDNTHISGIIGQYSSLNLHYLAELDPVTGEEDAGLKPDSRFLDASLCRLPQTLNEVAITDFIAEAFMRSGYDKKEHETASPYVFDDTEGEEEETIIPINTPDDLIGEKFKGLTITGVYSTDVDLETYKEYEIDRIEDLYVSNMVYGLENSILSFRFVVKGYSATHFGALIKLSGDKGKDRALLDTLSKRTSSDSVNLISPYSTLISDATAYERYMLNVVMIFVGVFAVASALLTANFLTVSIAFRKKELGILRALGARPKEIYAVCLSESFIVAGGEFLLSLIGVGIVSGVLNSVFGVPLFIVGILPILSMFGLCFGVAALATIAPVKAILRKKPIDIINDK